MRKSFQRSLVLVLAGFATTLPADGQTFIECEVSFSKASFLSESPETGEEVG